jgi:hydroxyversicolorone monooxygenase
MQPYVKHMDIFIRTGVWFIQIANNYGQNYEYTAEQKDIFRHNPDELVKHAKDIEDQINGLWGGFYKNSEMGRQMESLFLNRMKEWIKDERLLKGFTPKFGIGCRRVTPGDPYMLFVPPPRTSFRTPPTNPPIHPSSAIQKPNVDVHFTPVTRISPHAIHGADGTTRPIDTIICATGFDTSYRPRFPIIGTDNIPLSNKWHENPPEAYLGLAIPTLPNFLTFIGPNWPVENGSVMGPLSAVADYAVQFIHKMQAENILSIVPNQAVTDRFNVHCQEWVRHTVWVDDCRSWYRDNDSGRVNAIWPGGSLHYCEVISRPRYEDFDIVYAEYPGDGEGEGANQRAPMRPRDNMWAFLGMGNTIGGVLKHDPSPYMARDKLDPAWLEAVGCDERLRTGKKVGKTMDGAPTGGVVGGEKEEEKKEEKKEKEENKKE